MRREPTRAEAKLWQSLRAHRLGGWKWRRQTPFGPFIVDFLCDRARLIVELDGAAHGERDAYDADRSDYLARFGFHVLRFANAEVEGDISGVCERILAACGSRPLGGEVAASEPPSPYPLPLGEGF